MPSVCDNVMMKDITYAQCFIVLCLSTQTYVIDKAEREAVHTRANGCSLKNTFTMTGLFNYSGDAGLRQPYLHNLTLELNTLQGQGHWQNRSIKMIHHRNICVSRHALKAPFGKTVNIVYDQKHTLGWLTFISATHPKRKQVLESTCYYPSYCSYCW